MLWLESTSWAMVTVAMSQPNSKICLLCSGGIDSALLLQKAQQAKIQVYPLYIACGFRWEQAEQDYLKRQLENFQDSILQKLKILQVPLQDLFPNHWAFGTQAVPDRYSQDPEVELPGRNLILLSQAALYCQVEGLSEIWLGSLAGNPFPDATVEFFSQMEMVCSQTLQRKLKIRAPYLQTTKTQLIQQHPNFPFQLTFTCLDPQAGQHCGNCNKCEERRKHFHQAGILDPTQYKNSF